MKIFVRERRRSDKGQQRPRFRIVAVDGGKLRFKAKRLRKCELDEIAKQVGAEVVYLEREGEGAGGGKAS